MSVEIGTAKMQAIHKGRNECLLVLCVDSLLDLCRGGTFVQEENITYMVEVSSQPTLPPLTFSLIGYFLTAVLSSQQNGIEGTEVSQYMPCPTSVQISHNQYPPLRVVHLLQLMSLH